MSRERDGGADAAAEQALEQLFAQATPRVQPPVDAAAEIKAAVLAEWEQVTGRRKRHRRAVAAGAVAATLMVAAAATLLELRAPPVVLVAQVERIEGVVTGDPAPLSAAAELHAGDVVATADGQIALRLADGGSLRIAPQSRVELTGRDAVRLVDGALYFDSEHSRGTAMPFTVATRFGTLSDVGTQFMTRVGAMQLTVGVRNGRVAFAESTARAEAGQGERLTIARDATVRRESIPTFGEYWSWTERLAPPFEIDGRRLGDFLDWVAAQTGRKIELADAAAREAARTSILTGSIDLPPLPKLTAVLALTDLDYTLDGDRIVIRAAD